MKKAKKVNYYPGKEKMMMQNLKDLQIKILKKIKVLIIIKLNQLMKIIHKVMK